MKTIKMSLKSIVLILAGTLVINSAFAAGHTGAALKTQTQVSHAGLVNNEPVVQLQFDNAKGEKVFINVKDENGIVVYSELFSGKSYSKKFLFESELADANPVITVTYLESNTTETYVVSRKESSVSSVSITKL
jgi:hypothetical protein